MQIRIHDRFVLFLCVIVCENMQPRVISTSYVPMRDLITYDTRITRKLSLFEHEALTSINTY